MQGTPSQGYCPNIASVIFVKTFARISPPRFRTFSRARAMNGSRGDTPASFNAKYVFMVADRSDGPPR